MDEELKRLLEASDRILITSHTSPDADALSSVLLLGRTLKHNYPPKQIAMVLEEKPSDLSFLPGFDDIQFNKILDSLTDFKPDLVVILDGNNFDRVSRHDGLAIRKNVLEAKISTVIIDHHEPAGKEPADVYINQGSPATVQDIYELCFGTLKLKKPDRYAQIAMVGLYSDTGGFTYIDKRPAETLKMIGELISDGANVEKIRNSLEQYTDEDIEVFGELADNLRADDGFSYSCLSDEFVNRWLAAGRTAEQLHGGVELFVNRFIRNIGGRQWGFIIYRNVLQGKNIYSVSLRAVGAANDVAAIANKLGGGGHKPAAGAKFEATDLNEAINIVKAAIDTA